MNKNTLFPSPIETRIWGLIFLLIPFIALVLASCTFAMGGVIATWMFPSAVAVALATGHLCIKAMASKPHAIWRFYIYSIALLALSLLSSAILYDNSYDGNTYHQGSIIDMLQGVNPFHNPTEFFLIWSKHYAKSLEIVAATISICFNRIECGKAVNLLLILASIFTTYAFLRKEFEHHTVGKSLFLTLLLALCPVVVRQSYIYYNDFALYTLPLMATIALIEIFRRDDKLSWYILIATTLIAATTKFTIAFYLYLIIAIAIAWYFLAGKRSLCYKTTYIAVALLIVGLCMLGYHPYITNIQLGGNPFYPLVGGNVDIMSSNTPTLFVDGNRLANWLRSLFYNAQGTGVWIPFVNDSLYDYYIAYDSRIAGFGPLFGYTLIASIILFAIAQHQERRTQKHNKTRANTFTLLAIILLAACFIFEQSWWARYIPFLWAIPIMLTIYTEYNQNLSRALRILRNAIYAALCATILLCCAATIIGGMSYTQRLGAIYNSITPQSSVEVYSGTLFKSINYKLQERNIQFTILHENQPSDSTLLPIEVINQSVIYLDEKTYSRIKRPDMIDFMQKHK